MIDVREWGLQKLTHFLQRREIIAIAILAGALIVSSVSPTFGNQTSSSPEVRFTDASQKGLSIVPASCPSDPHYSGQCSGETIPGRCSLTASPYTISPGQSSTLSWSVADDNGLCDSGAGCPGVPPDSAQIGPDGVSVSVPSGSRDFSPSQTTLYVLRATYPTGRVTQCSARVTVSPASGGSCTMSWSPSTVVQGQHSTLTWNAAHAGTIYYPGGSFPAPASGSGGADGGSQSMTYRFVDGVNGQECSATLTVCPAGQTIQNGQCVAQSCTAGYYCSGSDLYYRTAQCAAQFIQACGAYGCAGNSCLPPPPPTGTISVVPSLVHSGETTQVSWSATNVSSCTVTENNPTIQDSWAGATGTETSSTITQRTVYRLHCTGIDGSELNATAIVNIVPVEHEL